MGFLKSMEISGSALTAQRLRMDTIAENIANMNTTRTAEGGTYRRRMVVMQEKTDATSFSNMYERAMNSVGTSNDGVVVTEIVEDKSDFRLDYNPTHPDADENGYVQMPNVDIAVETVDLMEATRSYEANITAINAFKNIASKALEI